MKWSDIESSPQYVALPDDKKSAAKVKYFDTVATADPKFKALSADDQKKARDGFLTRPAAAAPDLVSTGRAIEGTGDVGITPLGASETLHDVARAAAGKVKEAAAGPGIVKKAIRGVAGVADVAQSLVPLGPEDEIMNAGVGEALKAAGATPLGKAAAQGASKLWSAVKPAATAAMSPIAERGILAARELGIPLTYAEFSQSKTAAQMESLAKKIPFLSDVMGRADRAKSAALSDARTSLLRGLGDTPGEQTLGEQARPALEERLANVDKARAQRYGALREEAAPGAAPALPEQRTAAILASKAGRDKSMRAYRGELYDRAEASIADPDAKIEPAQLKDAADKVQGSYSAAGAKSLRGKAYSVAGDYVKEPAGTAPAVPPGMEHLPPEKLARLQAVSGAAAHPPEATTMTPAELRAEVSNLGDAAEAERRPDRTLTKDGKHLNDMKMAAKADLDAFYKTQSPETQRAYALADAFHGEYSDRMRNDTIARLYKEAPSQTFDSIMKSGDADLTGKLAAALGPDGKTVLKRQLFDNVFGTGKEIPDARTVVKSLSDYGPGIRAVFKPAEVDALKRFALTGEAPPFVQSEFERTARSLVKSDPAGLSKAILGGNADIARAAKKYLPAPTFQAYGRQLAENILASSETPEMGFKDVLKRLDDKQDVLKEFFPKATIDGMRRIGEASQILPGYGDLAMRPPSSTGSAVAMGMWGIILHPSKLVAGGVGIGLIGAHQLAELYTSDTGRRWITTMMRMSADDPRVPALAARGVQLAAQAMARQPAVQKKMAAGMGIE